MPTSCRRFLQLFAFFLLVASAVIHVRVINLSQHHVQQRRILHENINSEASTINVNNKKRLANIAKAHSLKSNQRQYSRQSSRLEATTSLKRWEYFSDELCGGCRSLKPGDGRRQTCGDFIYRRANSKKISLLEAAKIEVEVYNLTACHRCLSCSDDSRKYFRYDDAAPSISAAKSHYLSSIPSKNRIKKEMLTSKTSDKSLVDFFSWRNNSYPLREYFFEYNPSLIRLPQDQIPDIPGDDSPAVYLASYRVSNQQNCFHSNVSLAMIGGSWDFRPKKQNYLALALLRSDLSMIQDVVVDLPQSFGLREDFRLFLLHGQLYVGSMCQILPLWVKRPNSMDGKVIGNNVFPSPMQVMLGENRTFCSSYFNDKDSAKNLNYFVDSNNNTMVEMTVLRPRTLHIIDPIDQEDRPPHPDNAIKDLSMSLVPSFFTTEEVDLSNRFGFHDNPFSTNRGGACCVAFLDPRNNNPDQNNLLLGIAHVKSPFNRRKLERIVEGNRYLSRFYAFNPKAPEQVVAMSGFFCLAANPRAHSSGIPSPLDHVDNSNPLTRLPLWNPLNIGGTDFEGCPAIHFITGLTEKADDSSKLIIAYGVNDCTSWFIEVDKGEVLDLLFYGPSKTTTRQMEVSS